MTHRHLLDRVTFGAEKNLSNKEKHGFGLDEFLGFDTVASVTEDARAQYGEALQVFWPNRKKGLYDCLHRA